MSAYRDDAQLGARRPDILENRLGQLRRGLLWQEYGGQKPGRPRSQAGDIVRVDVHRVAADLLAGEGDRVRLRDENASAAEVDRRGVTTDARSQDQPWVGGEPLQQAREEIRGQLSRLHGRREYSMAGNARLMQRSRKMYTHG